MNILAVIGGLVLATAGLLILLRQPTRYTNVKNLGILFLVLGEVMLFSERWWLAILGLVGGSLLVGFGRAMFRSRSVGDAAPSYERIINKQDTDRVFSLTRGEWNREAEMMSGPDGWDVRLIRHDTGTAVAARDPKTGLGLSTSPFFSSEDGPPDVLVVTSYFPARTVEQGRLDLSAVKAGAESDLGPEYAVEVGFDDLSSTTSGLTAVRIMITRVQQ